jgi:UPF0755 protein
MADEPTWDDLFGQSPPESTPVPPKQPFEQLFSPPARQNAEQPPQQLPQAPQQPPQAQAQPPAQPVSRRELRESESQPRQRLGDGGGRPPRNSRQERQPSNKPKRRLTWLWVLLSLFALGVAGVAGVWFAFEPQIRHVMGWEAPTDYTGNGNGKPATITIVAGQIGGDIAQSLHKAGVTATSTAFYNLLLKQTKQPNFEPGTYKLQKQMSAKTALADLLDPKNRVVSRIVIPEGDNLTQFYAHLSKGTGLPVSAFDAAGKNYTALGVPSSAPSLEGFLFPATYQFSPGTSATVILQTLVKRMYQSLNAAGVAPADRLRVLTLASIVQKEGGSTSDFFKVARVFQNRLDQHMLLQSDATVSYGAHSSTISTTGAQRADASNPYNTYVHQGLPVGPIASPGDAAIKAALNPVAGSWLYFVLVNGSTGETVFSDTLAQHDVAVKQWQTWLKAHPGYGG